MRKSEYILSVRGWFYVTIAGWIITLPASAQDAAALLEQGRTQYEAQQYEEAEETLRALVKQESISAPAYLWLGRVLDAQTRYKDAEKEIKKALKIDKTLTEGHIELAKVYIHREKNKDARKALDKAEKLEPDNADCSSLDRPISLPRPARNFHMILS